MAAKGDYSQSSYLVGELMRTAYELVTSEARELEIEDPDGCRKVAAAMTAGGVPQITIVLDPAQPEICCEIVSADDRGGEALQVFRCTLRKQEDGQWIRH